MISQQRSPGNRHAAARVLIAEDDPHSRWVLCALLKRLGFDCRTASDGREAMSLVEQFRPEIILMDLMMPGVSGLDATRALKSDDRTRDIPIVALTGNITPGFERAAEEAGCDDFVPKPIVLQELLERVRRLLEAH